MAARLIPAYQTFHTSNGVSPLSGGKIHFYVSESVDTDKDTFSDDTLLTANTNPLILDSAGRVQVDVWGDGLYKMVVADSTDTPIDTFDPIAGGVSVTPVNTIADLTALLEASLSDGGEMDVSGYYAQGDGGGGRFYWDASSTATDNGGTVLAPDVTDGTGRWIRIVNGDLTAFMFGSGLGQADDTVAIQAFVTEIGDGAGRFPSGAHIITSEITSTGSPRLYGDGVGTFINATDGAFSGSSVFDFSGAAPTQIEELGANATVGDNALTFASAPSLSVGDAFFIYNPTTFSFSGWRSNYHAGEWCEVASISGSVVTLKNRLYDSYVIASVDVYKANLIAPSLRDMKIIGLISSNAARFEYCTGNLSSNINIEHGNNIGMAASRCFNFNIERPRIKNEGDGGDDYGLSIGNSQDGIISDVNLYGRRHAVNMGGGDFIGAVPDRNIRVIGGTLKNDQSLSTHNADFHGNCEDCSYENVTITGAAAWQGKGNGYSNCHIFGRNDGVVIAAGELLGGRHYATDCRYSTHADPNTDGRGVFDVGGNSSAITSDTVEDVTFDVNGHVFGRNLSSGTRMLLIENDGTDQKINVRYESVSHDVDDMAGFVRVTLNSGTADSDFLIVDQIQSNVGGVLLSTPNSDYRFFPKRLMRQSGSEVLTTNGTAELTGTPVVFKYAYDTTPQFSAARGNDQGGLGGPVGVALCDPVSSSGLTPKIKTDTGNLFNSGVDVTVVWEAFINDGV